MKLQESGLVRNSYGQIELLDVVGDQQVRHGRGGE
jgi:hypothetical protein